jgi:hypothetical protein
MRWLPVCLRSATAVGGRLGPTLDSSHHAEFNGSVATAIGAWEVAGSYFEACNCDAVCPCRRVEGRAGGRSTYGVCQFALSWLISHGSAGSLNLDGLALVMAGWYDDDEPASPWRANLYVDERAGRERHDALAAIFLGQAGGTTFENFAAAIGTVHAVRTARIELSHVRRRWFVRAETYVEVTATTPVLDAGAVSCGIPGHDHPGQELISDSMLVRDPPLGWELRERCGFATDFRYQS